MTVIQLLSTYVLRLDQGHDRFVSCYCHDRPVNMGWYVKESLSASTSALCDVLPVPHGERPGSTVRRTRGVPLGSSCTGLVPVAFTLRLYHQSLGV